MNNIQPQGAAAPQPVYQQQAQPQQVQPMQQQPMQQPMQQQPMQQPQQVQQQPQQQAQFFGASISAQDSQVVNQLYGECLQGLGLQHLNDSASTYKSLYYGARELFKNTYVTQLSAQTGETAKSQDYTRAQDVFEATFGTISAPRCSEAQLCLAMKAFASRSLPDQDPSLAEPWSPIRDYLLDANWHSQNVRNALNTALKTNGNGNGYTNGNGNGSAKQDAYNPYAQQSKAAAAAGAAPAPQPVYQQPQANYAPQQTAQGLVNAMPTYPVG